MNNNLLIVQCGEMSAVSNAVISGAVKNAKASGKFSSVYGAVGGMFGIIDENFTDLSVISECELAELTNTSGCILATAGGNLAYDFGDYEYTRMLDVLSEHDVTHIIMLCDKSGLVLADKLAAFSEKSGKKIVIAAIPVSPYNDVKTASYNIGYRTAAKFVATSVAHAYADISAHTNERAVMLFETPELYTGWLSIAASLASYNGKRCAALTFVPEAPFDRSDFVLHSVPVLEHESNVALTVFPKGATNKDGAFFFPQYDMVHDYYGSLYKHEFSSYIAYTARENLLQNVHVFEANGFWHTSPYVLDSNDLELAKRASEIAVKYVCENNTSAAIDTTSENNEICVISELAKDYNHIPTGIYDEANFKIADEFISELDGIFGDDVRVNASYKLNAFDGALLEKKLPAANIRFR